MMEDITLLYVEVGWVSVSLIPEIMKLGDTGAVTFTPPPLQQERDSDRDKEPLFGKQGKVSALKCRFLALGEIKVLLP